MSETLNVGLTKQQRDIILRGLRYVRSSALLEPREPSAEVEADRRSQLKEIGQIVAVLTGSESAAALS